MSYFYFEDDATYDWVAVERVMSGRRVCGLTDDDLVEIARRLQAAGYGPGSAALANRAHVSSLRARRAWHAARTDGAALTPDLMALISLFMLVAVVLPLHGLGVLA